MSRTRRSGHRVMGRDYWGPGADDSAYRGVVLAAFRRAVARGLFWGYAEFPALDAGDAAERLAPMRAAYTRKQRGWR